MPDKVSIIRNECPTLRCVLELKSWGFFFSFLQVTAERNISLCSRCQAMWLERLKLNATFPLIVKFESDIGMSIIVAFDGRRFKVCGSLRPLLGTLGDDKMLLHSRLSCTDGAQYACRLLSQRCPVIDMIWRVSSPASEKRPTSVLRRLWLV